MLDSNDFLKYLLIITYTPTGTQMNATPITINYITNLVVNLLQYDFLYIAVCTLSFLTYFSYFYIDQLIQNRQILGQQLRVIFK